MHRLKKWGHMSVLLEVSLLPDVCECMYRGRPFVEMPMGPDVLTGPRGGTHRDRGSNIPTQRYYRYRFMHADLF